MIDKNLLLNDFQKVESALKNRNAKIDLSEITKLILETKKQNLEIESLNKKKNELSSQATKDGLYNDPKKLASFKKEMDLIKSKIEKINLTLKDSVEELNQLLLYIPNIPQESVPIGKDENDNPVIKHFGEPTKFNFTPLSHWEIATKKDIIDFERATKITGSRFVAYKNKGAQLIRALQNFTLDLHKESGFTEFAMPVIVSETSLYGTGNLPKFAEDLFKLEDSKYYLSPTLEIQLTNYYRNEILLENNLPYKFCASSLNFRSEAGASGRDTKGVIRQHQFYKTELVILSKQEESHEMHELMTAQAEKVLETLGLPYRRILLCTGDMGFSSAKTYDLEVWLPSYNAYKEISSVSNCESFQARRASIRYHSSTSNKKELVHTLNGSALAIDRLWAAIVENYQDENGVIHIPKVLEKYTDFKTI